MSKVDTEFCDCCGGILYHSVASFKLPIKTFKRQWWWHGQWKQSGSYDLCGDCFNAISDVLEKRQEKITKMKLAATDKSPADLMEARKPINKQEAEKLLDRENTSYDK